MIFVNKNFELPIKRQIEIENQCFEVKININDALVFLLKEQLLLIQFELKNVYSKNLHIH